MSTDLEAMACVPAPVDLALFNPRAALPHGLTVEHIGGSMAEFCEFIGFINAQLQTRELARLETMLMPANFSSMVGEFMGSNIPKHCSTLVKNQYHNGHPDLLPADRFPGDRAQHATEGVEIKASRYLRGWQGHNAEDTWLMVFVFDSNRPVDAGRAVAPRPFRFVQVLGAQLAQDDWSFAGRSVTSRRTITASVTPAGYEKMAANWIYGHPGTVVVRDESWQPEPPTESDLLAK